jgi:hypothetical protein
VGSDLKSPSFQEYCLGMSFYITTHYFFWGVLSTFIQDKLSNFSTRELWKIIEELLVDEEIPNKTNES